METHQPFPFLYSSNEVRSFCNKPPSFWCDGKGDSYWQKVGHFDVVASGRSMVKAKKSNGFITVPWGYSRYHVKRIRLVIFQYHRLCSVRQYMFYPFKLVFASPSCVVVCKLRSSYAEAYNSRLICVRSQLQRLFLRHFGVGQTFCKPKNIGNRMSSDCGGYLGMLVA